MAIRSRRRILLHPAVAEFILMGMEKPWNDVADQLRTVEPEAEAGAVDEEAAVGRSEPAPEPLEVSEADPADVADQRRVVPLPDDGPVSGDGPVPDGW
ncbi:hypothetical protein [Saccharothrix sp. NRRL B-16314]|uniref:hypothetical protein n=1 Tax=Saccharothrix sp. NRRL B-16314 TaxID=1463825 RepID=UPI001E4A24A7|nr:hypothetical protein [Saccharothrix sp. NRRL B-16314]